MDHQDRDLHVLKYFSSVVTISEGKVINVTDPHLRFCPLARHFYPAFKKARPDDLESLRAAVRETIESKIRDYGLFTARRSFNFPIQAVPYGASEMLSLAMKNGFLDAAVIVCDGAGTVITSSPEITQQIGARMNTLIFTSPIPVIQKKLKKEGCYIPFEKNAWIDPLRGVEKAVSMGYKKIGVTIVGSSSEQFLLIRDLQKRSGTKIVSLSVCTSGLSSNKINLISRYADLVWACASSEVREQIGKNSLLQISKQIPVYTLTAQGTAFAAACTNNPALINELDPAKQYLLSNEPGNQSVRFGNLLVYLKESSLQKSPLSYTGKQKERASHG